MSETKFDNYSKITVFNGFFSLRTCINGILINTIRNITRLNVLAHSLFSIYSQILDLDTVSFPGEFLPVRTTLLPGTVPGKNPWQPGQPQKIFVSWLAWGFCQAICLARTPCQAGQKSCLDNGLCQGGRPGLSSGKNTWPGRTTRNHEPQRNWGTSLICDLPKKHHLIAILS